MIRPVWFEMMVEDNICRWDKFFGMVFSNQIRSRRRDAVFWLRIKLYEGIRRCVVVE